MVAHSALLRGKTARRAGSAVAFALTCCALLMPHLVPAASFAPGFAALDAQTDVAFPPADPTESAAHNFAGSAYFFAENAFAPAPAVRARASAHILPLEEVTAAPATPFHAASPLDRYRALNCLTTAIYYEAANEPDEGQRAVAQVVLNRVRHPAWPDSVCGVVYQGTERTDMRCQFTFTCDGSMARHPVADKWARARSVATRALSGDVFAPVGMATHYHTLAVRPVWSSSLDPVAVVGAHIFYAMRGMNGTPRAFLARYTGREGGIGPSVRAYIRPVQAAPVPLAMPFDLPAYVPPPAPLPSAPALAPPAAGWTPPAPPAPRKTDDALPESTIKPEYRNSGRPLI